MDDKRIIANVRMNAVVPRGSPIAAYVWLEGFRAMCRENLAGASGEEKKDGGTLYSTNAGAKLDEPVARVLVAAFICLNHGGMPVAGSLALGEGGVPDLVLEVNTPMDEMVARAFAEAAITAAKGGMHVLVKQVPPLLAMVA